MNLYTVYDSKAQYYFPIFCARTDNEARRMFIVSIKETFDFRGDYYLLRVGEFDQDEGMITPQHESVMDGMSIGEEHNPQTQIPFPEIVEAKEQ